MVHPYITYPRTPVYDTNCLQEVVESVKHDERFTCVVGFGGGEDKPESSKPLLLNTTQLQSRVISAPHVEIHEYPVASPHFVIPTSGAYDPGSAALAHTRTLVFLRKHVGGPHFDLEVIWDEHTYFEFEARSVAKTMGTMVVSYFFKSPHQYTSADAPTG
jgi:carboxymethylenebutenolidase